MGVYSCSFVQFGAFVRLAMGGFDSLNQNIFGFTALVVSVVALFTTVLQVLQQYFSSADGYRRCAESVMGLWAQGTHRKLRMYEFRVEVVFETPVIFLAPPTNTRGPVIGRKINYIDGTPESYTATRVLPQSDQKKADEQAAARVHTADDERASWVTLLSTLQREESESRKWDEDMRMKTPPPAAAGNLPKPPNYDLAVGVQRKTRSWDFMPSAITRPYATSAICHLIEMMAMLGMYWKVFDQIVWNLRAEGNGFILTSTTVHGLGVMVVFATTGKSKFLDNRVIPAEKIKDLAFGVVPNIFDNELYLEREKDAQSVELQFGTKDDVETTLESLGCQAETLKKYAKDHKHIFSVSFEIIGMLGQVIRIRGSSFRMIPNPTSDYWLKNIGKKASWKMTRLMEVFQDKLKELADAEGFGPAHEITTIRNHWVNISRLDCQDETNLSIQCREAIHDALDSRTEFLLKLKQAEVLSVLVAHVAKVIDILDDPVSPLNTIVLANKEEALLSHYFYEIRPAVIGILDSNKKPLSNIEKEQRNTIWISLIFRMLCWLLIHDFDKSDIKIVPSELNKSRMPIFIG